MATASWTRRTADATSRSTVRRERVSIDLRGHGLALTAVAQSKGVPVAVLVRQILAEWLQTRAVAESGARSAPDVAPAQPAESVIKLTLRMRAGHAHRLARAARAAEHSQGAYVERLMDELPPAPVSPDLRESRAALMRSTSTLAAMSGDLQMLVRILRQSAPLEQSVCAAAVARLSDAVLLHLSTAAPLLAALKSARRPAAVEPD